MEFIIFWGLVLFFYITGWAGLPVIAVIAVIWFLFSYAPEQRRQHFDENARSDTRSNTRSNTVRRNLCNKHARQNALNLMRAAEKQEIERLSSDMNYAELILHAAKKHGAENPVLVADGWMRARATQVNISPVKYEHIRIDGSRVWMEVKPDISLIINGRDARWVEDFVVYSAMCIPTGKCYIGQTKRGLEARQAEHYENAYKGSKHCPLFYEALRQYPPRNWKWSIIGRAKSRDELNAMEIRAITKYSRHPRGYNWHEGGE